MPGQLRATSKPLKQVLASHFFSPRNTRSTRKEVDKESDEKVLRHLRLEIFASFRVFRGPKATVTRSNVATNASNLLIIIAELWAGTAT